jgi:hypothetical protein
MLAGLLFLTAGFVLGLEQRVVVEGVAIGERLQRLLGLEMPVTTLEIEVLLDG